MKEKLLAILSGYTGRTISAEASLDELAMDSLETIELIRQIETEFGCTIPDADIGTIHRVEDFFRYLPA